MSLSQAEIFNQYKSLSKTYELFEEKRGDILSVLGGYNRFVFFGCGSSYSLAKSAAMSASIYGADGAVAIAAGDYIVNHEQYSKATGLECLFGGLYLMGKQERINELFLLTMEEPHAL